MPRRALFAIFLGAFGAVVTAAVGAGRARRQLRWPRRRRPTARRWSRDLFLRHRPVLRQRRHQPRPAPLRRRPDRLRRRSAHRLHRHRQPRRPPAVPLGTLPGRHAGLLPQRRLRLPRWSSRWRRRRTAPQSGPRCSTARRRTRAADPTSRSSSTAISATAAARSATSSASRPSSRRISPSRRRSPTTINDLACRFEVATTAQRAPAPRTRSDSPASSPASHAGAVLSAGHRADGLSGRRNARQRADPRPLAT